MDELTGSVERITYYEVPHSGTTPKMATVSCACAPKDRALRQGFDKLTLPAQ